MKECRCPKCNEVLNIDGSNIKCEHCKSSFSSSNFIDYAGVDYIIPFKLTKKEAIKIYKRHIKSLLLTPPFFKSTRNINKMQGIYVPTYIYNLDSTGLVDFECDKISFWKSSGIRYEKTDVYKVIRGGDISIKNMTFLMTKSLSDEKLDNILPYDYNNLLSFDKSLIKDYKVYFPNKSKNELLESINFRTKQFFINELKKDIKGYTNIKNVDNSINLYNPIRKYVFLPIYILNLKHNGVEYTYLINGENGKFYGNIPINKKRIAFIWMFLFTVIFFTLLFLKVIL